MPTDAAFLAAMAATPFDDLPRLQYADWLDDRGDARAEWVRLEVAVCPHFRHVEDWDRFVQLSATLPPEWLATAGWYRWPLLVAQLGRRREDTHFQYLLETVHDGKKHLCYNDGHYTEQLGAAGLILKFRSESGPEVLSLVSFFTDKAAGSKRFPGPLPYGLSVDAPWSDVELLLGPPDLRFKSYDSPVWQSWNYGICVLYPGADLDDRNNTFIWVSVASPDVAGTAMVAALHQEVVVETD